MIIIGIVGGIASGKSTVTAKLKQLGAIVLDVDRIGHAVLDLPEVVVAAQTRWGNDVLQAGNEMDGSDSSSRSRLGATPQTVGKRPANGAAQIDRRSVAKRVFSQTKQGKEDLAFWEGITHPLIGRQLAIELDKLPAQSIVVLDAAVMFKTGWDERCHHILFVDTPIEQRRQRAIESRGWTLKQHADRELSQLPTEEKKRRSSSVIDNSRSLTETYEQIDRFWNSLSN